jgi:hypothetical protein
VRTKKEIADLSTTLRSGLDDKFVGLRKTVHRLEKPQFTENKFVISTGAKRSGEICGFFFGSHANSKARTPQRSGFALQTLKSYLSG